MKMLFCYDGPIEKDLNGEFYSPALNNKMFKRYENITNDLRIAIRVRNVEKDYNDKKKTENYLSKEKYKIIECPNISSLKGIFIDIKKAKLILEKEIKDVDFLIIRLPSMIGNLAVNIAKKMNKPYLIEMVGCPWDALWNYSLKGKLFAPFMTYMTKKRVKNASYVLYVTKEFLQRRYPTKGKKINCSNVILNNVDEENIKKREEKIYHDTGNNIKVIATTAAIDVKYKGQKYVIKAINKLKKQGKMFEYWIIGGGDKSYLQKYVKRYKLENQVKFLGALPHDEVFKKLQDVDIYIQPSKQEGLPRALIEAMSMGCLCIGSNAGGTPELLDNKYIFEKGNTRKLAKILYNISKRDYVEQGEKNYNNSKNYNNEVLQNRRREFYIDFINEEMC